MIASPSPSDRLRRARRRLKLLAGDHQVLLPLYLRLTLEGTSRSITAATEIVVDGFQRSGTTYTATSLRLAQPDGVLMATHVHNIAILKKAIGRGLPTLVVVREPLPCLSSYIVWDPSIGARTVLWEWLHYHRHLVGLAPQVAIATFDQVTDDLGAVIGRMNKRYRTEFAVPPDSACFRAEVEAEIRATNRVLHADAHQSRTVPIPDDGRADELGRWRHIIENDVNLAGGLREADHLFAQLRSYSLT